MSGVQQRAISLPAVGKAIPLRAYVRAIERAEANPETSFRYGLTTWWPTTGAEIRQQFLAGLHDRINAGVPYVERGRTTFWPRNSKCLSSQREHQLGWALLQ